MCLLCWLNTTNTCCQVISFPLDFFWFELTSLSCHSFFLLLFFFILTSFLLLWFLFCSVLIWSVLFFTVVSIHNERELTLFFFFLYFLFFLWRIRIAFITIALMNALLWLLVFRSVLLCFLLSKSNRLSFCLSFFLSFHSTHTHTHHWPPGSGIRIFTSGWVETHCSIKKKYFFKTLRTFFNNSVVGIFLKVGLHDAEGT
jgi:hypothetical protein